MIISILLSFLAVIISIIFRYSIFQTTTSKIKASWISFGLAIVATTICTLISGGEQQSTLITGFATMLLTYNILIR